MHSMRRLAARLLLGLVALAAHGALVPAACAQAGGDESSLIAALETARDDADAEQVAALALRRTPTAAQALVDFYGKVASIWMKREVVRALGQFDAAGDAAAIALDHVATIAANAQEPELRDAAFEALAGCRNRGPAYLAKIVELPVQDQVRERALELHGKLADAKANEAWYRKLYADEKLPKKLRERAFAALVQGMKDAELIKAFKELHDGTLRRLALEALATRDVAATADLAVDTLKQVNALPTDRAAAARVLAAKKGAKAADLLIEIGLTQATTGEHLRAAVAKLLADLQDEAVDKRLAGLVGKGKAHEKLFALQAVRGRLVADDKLRKKVRAHLDDKEAEVRRLAIEVVGEARDVEAAAELEALLAKPKEKGDLPVIVAALTAIRAGEPAWRERLLALAVAADRDLRNAALQSLAAAPQTADLALFLRALGHADWSTRLIALSALEKLRDRDSVGAIVAQMQAEAGRTLAEFGAALFRLTGELHDTDAATWKRWWEGPGRSLPLISAAELEKKVAERERKRLQQTTLARFFGVKIESRAVTFIVDISGSMAEQLESSLKDGRPATRMEVVKRELVKAIEALEPGAAFNIVVFNAAVSPWKPALVTLDDKTRAEAIDYVQHLGSRGGTNIYDALESTFLDPAVDTVFLLTDGEPSAGGVTDLQLIREHVARWNSTRHLTLHCIGVGGDFPLLEWIAADAGGTYTKFN